MKLSQAVLTSQRQYKLSELLDEFAILRARFIQEGFEPPSFPKEEPSFDDWFALGVNLAATFPQTTSTNTFVRIGKRHSNRVVATMNRLDGEWNYSILDSDEKDEIIQFIELLRNGQIKYTNCA